MLKKSLFLLSAGAVSATLMFSSCGDKDKSNTVTDFQTLESQVLSNFVSTVGTPLYSDFQSRALTLKNAVAALAADPTPANQTAAQTAWASVRQLWEQSEGFLIGPVDDNSYDPYMDTWPTDRNELDALLAGTQSLDAASLGSYESDAELTLRGFHPLEYLLWKSGLAYTDREKEYMIGLSEDIANNVTKLNTDWGPYSNELVNPAVSGSRYDNKKDALLVLSEALVGICVEVGEGKMLEPFGETANLADSTISESPYSHNSLVDFKNNIIGARNVYLCSYNNTTGKSLSDLVAANNKTLDQSIKAKFEAAINSFDGITTTFEQAIYTQRPAVQNVLDAIADLKETCDGPLQDYINTYVKD